VRDARLHIVFVAGLSGSGKSTAMAALEDLAFYCVDNLPPQLVDQFIHLCQQGTPPIEKIALAVDSREAQFLENLPGVIRALRESGARVDLIYLDCANEVLVHRYRETRRVHPHASGRPVEEGVEAERGLLADVAALADHVIDTSSLNVHRLKRDVVERIGGRARATVVNLVSFGFRYPTPQTVELLFDVRFLPNPYFEENLRPRSGLDEEVASYALENDRGKAFFERLHSMVRFLLPLYEVEGKAYLTIGVGCTGGRHRSVAIVEALAEELRAAGREVNVEHRDVERSP
jgi:UPF0042 nucleotide-binding protein